MRHLSHYTDVARLSLINIKAIFDVIALFVSIFLVITLPFAFDQSGSLGAVKYIGDRYVLLLVVAGISLAFDIVYSYIRKRIVLVVSAVMTAVWLIAALSI